MNQQKKIKAEEILYTVRLTLQRKDLEAKAHTRGTTVQQVLSDQFKIRIAETVLDHIQIMPLGEGANKEEVDVKIDFALCPPGVLKQFIAQEVNQTITQMSVLN